MENEKNGTGFAGESAPVKGRSQRGQRWLQGTCNIATSGNGTSNVVALPTAWRGCAGCGIQFRRRAPHHQLCTTCHAGAAAILALGRVRRLLAGA